MSIGAIQTEYAGYLFRSRLEARWAVFFDTLGFKWSYESEGFEGGGARYLPDFYLQDIGCWVEVKGDPKGMWQERSRICKVLLSGALPGVINSATDGGCRRGLLVLANIPQVGPKETPLFPILKHNASSGCIERWWFLFGPGGRAGTDSGDTLSAAMLGLDAQKQMESEDCAEGAWDMDARTINCGWNYAEVSLALDRARQARFEFGAKGN